MKKLVLLTVVLGVLTMTGCSHSTRVETYSHSGDKYYHTIKEDEQIIVEETITEQVFTEHYIQ